MEFQDVVRKRRMVRKYHRRPVPAEVVTRLLDNATRGPSARPRVGLRETEDCKRRVSPGRTSCYRRVSEGVLT